MKKIILFLSFLFGLLPQIAIAQRTRLAAALMDDSVLLTSNFNGAKLTMFGAVQLAGDKNTDIVIIIRGPNRQAWITKKSKIMGLWIGQKRVYFDAAPTFFGVASTRPIDEIAPKDTQSLYGMDALSQLNPHQNALSKQELEDFKTAFVNAREKQKLYINAPKAVQFMENGLFRADIRLPDLTPPGLYTVKVMVMKNKRPVDTTLQSFEVTKVGFERFIFQFARDNTFIYGLFGLFLALGAGFLSARLFRRING